MATSNLHPNLPNSNPLSALLNSMTVDEISNHPGLSAVYILELCQLTGVPIGTVTAALRTGDYTDLKDLTRKTIDLSPDYWQVFKDDAVSQAEALLGGEL